MTEEVWHEAGTSWVRICIMLHVWCRIHNQLYLYVFLSCCNTRQSNHLLRNCDRTWDRETVCIALQCSHGQLASLTPRTRIPICGRWSWERGIGSRPSWGPPPPSPCRWSPGSHSEAGSGDPSPPRHTAQRYHHKYPEQSRLIHLIISSERTRSLVTLNHLITCDKLQWMLNSTIETTAVTSCKESEVSFTSHKQALQ